MLRLTISHPARRGALDHAILDSLTTALDGVDETIRVVIISGSEGQFSSGYDIGDIPDDVFTVEAEKLVAHPFTAALDALEACDIPTIAALTGHTIGGGLELAITCDFRVAAEGIKLGMPPAKLGLVYSHTGLQRFIDTVGVPRTRELFLRGRNIDAREAHHWGLVTEVVALEAVAGAAVELATELVANSPLSMSGNKRILRELLSARSRLTGDVEQELIELRRASFESEDMREGVRAFAEKRPARWRGR